MVSSLRRQPPLLVPLHVASAPHSSLQCSGMSSEAQVHTPITRGHYLLALLMLRNSAQAAGTGLRCLLNV
jgi:hypothetical protein